MEQHGCIPNPVTREVLFLGGFCTHKGAPEVIPYIDLATEVSEISKKSKAQELQGID
jgi:hypothetical protein